VVHATYMKARNVDSSLSYILLNDFSHAKNLSTASNMFLGYLITWKAFHAYSLGLKVC